MSKALHDKLQDQGEADFKAGKPIDAFYDAPMPTRKQHSELYRASYETGWRNAQTAARRASAQLSGQS